MDSGYPDTPLQEGCFSSMRLRPWTCRRCASRRDGCEGEDPLWQDGGEEVFAGTGTAGYFHKKDPAHPTTPGLTHSTCRNGCARVSSGEDTIELPMENVTHPKYAVRDQRVQGGCK